MKKFTILIAVVVAFGLGWVANEQIGKKPEEAGQEAKGDGKNGDKPANQEDKEGGDSEKKDDPSAIPVAVSIVEQGDISSAVTFNTSVASEQSLDIHAETEGIIASIEVEEGDTVKAGDPLLKLVSDDFRIQKEETKANFDKLDREYTRAQEMRREDLISIQEYETKRYEYEQARLQYERDSLRYERTVVRSPIDGIVSQRFVQEGARITSALALFHVVNMDELIARVFIPEKLLDSVKVGQPVVIEAGSLPGKKWDGLVKRISPAVDIETGTFKVTLAIKRGEATLPTGLFISARILTDTHSDVPLLPKQAIIYESDAQYVYVVEDEKANKRRITPGLIDDTYVEALSAIEPGDVVIVQGQIGLKDEALVKVVGQAGDEAEIETKTAQSESEETEADENAS